MTGIYDPSNIEQYVRDTWGDANSCMSPNDRAQALVDDINRQLLGEGIPAVGWQFNTGLGNGAQFDFSTWYMELGTHNFEMDVAEGASVDEQAWTVSVVFHEARHAEQWFRMARERIGLGATPEQVAQVTGMPVWIAQQAAADPILQCDASQYEAEEWYHSVYGDGAGHRNEVLGDVQNRYDEYRSLPEEADAWNTTDDVADEYRRQSQ